jgi:ribose transport system ATP-binding protein
MNDKNHRVLFKAERISKAFPGVQALSDVNLDIRAGEILALVGENGAGKSTLIQILSGALAPDSGSIYLNDAEIHFNHPHEAEKAGISAVYQELSLVGNLNVAENIFAGYQPVGRLGLIDIKRMNQEAQRWLNEFSATFPATEKVGNLSMGNQQLVEIAKAMSRDAKVLILDEPTSSLTLSEAGLLFDLLRKLRERGIGILFVSHHLEEVFEISDRVTVLRDGQHVGTVHTAQSDEQEIVRMMVGRDLGDLENLHGSPEDLGDVALKVKGLSRSGKFQNINFDLRYGEILTFFGLVGAGRSEMARCIIGMDVATEGEIEIQGQKERLSHPADAMRLGMAYLSEDRKREGLYLDKTLKENFLVTNLRKVAPGGWLNWGKLDALTEKYVDLLTIRTPSLNQKLKNLSGGNQQKVLLGMWLATEPSVLIVDEPTRGIDVGTKQEIHRRLRELAKQGKAILAISSDLPETLIISDRIAVMREGVLEGILPVAEANEERIMVLAAGITQKGDRA